MPKKELVHCILAAVKPQAWALAQRWWAPIAHSSHAEIPCEPCAQSADRFKLPTLYKDMRN